MAHIAGKTKLPELKAEIISLCQQEILTSDLVGTEKILKVGKYDTFIPPNLLRQAFACNYFNLVELRELVNSW